MATNTYDFLLERMRGILGQVGVAPTAVTPNAHFMRDLGMDSLETVDLMMRMEQEFGLTITDEQMSTIHTVDQAVCFLQQELAFA